MPNQTKKKDVVIIGGGAGGLALAAQVARLGLQVGIVDKYPQLGGDCLHLGCIPSKALLAVAHLAQDFVQAAKQGLPNQMAIDWPQIQAHLHQIRKNIQPRYDQKKFEQLGCEVLIGEVTFIESKKLLIQETTTQATHTWLAKKIVIATGSRPMVLPIPGLAPSDVHTNETIYQIPSLPASMVIVGAGVTGIEFAQAFQRLGVKVTVLVHSARILRTLDMDGSALLTEVLNKEGVNIINYATIKQATKNAQNKIDLILEQKEHTLNLTTDMVFVATGRLPNIEHLGLETIGLKTTKQGIEVDAYFRTHLRHIYAIGDVVAWPHRFAHMAEYGAEVVFRHLSLKSFAPKAKLNWVPGVIFTHPEMASLGLTEQEAQAQKLSYEKLYWEFKESDRAAIDAQSEGFVKLLLVQQKVVGATVVCKRAGELLAELGLLMQKNLPISDLFKTIHAYPTWAEGLRKTIQAYLETKPAPASSLKRGISRILARI